MRTSGLYVYLFRHPQSISYLLCEEHLGKEEPYKVSSAQSTGYNIYRVPFEIQYQTPVLAVFVELIQTVAIPQDILHYVNELLQLVYLMCSGCQRLSLLNWG